MRNSWCEWRRGRCGTLDVVPDGFVCARNGKSIRIAWDEIEQVDAGVRDMLTADMFYVVLHTPSGNHAIDELYDGFRQLENAMFERWPHIKAQWTSLYAGPPFQPRRETLWRRAD
jgi:hypothetical protein